MGELIVRGGRAEKTETDGGGSPTASAYQISKGSTPPNAVHDFFLLLTPAKPIRPVATSRIRVEFEVGTAAESFVPVVIFAERRLASDPESETKSDMALSAFDDMTPNNIKTSMNMIIGVFIGTILSPSLRKVSAIKMPTF